MNPNGRNVDYNDTQRMQLRGLVLVAGEIIAHYWPMRTFVHHNPLHGLEDQPFEAAVRQGFRILGGNGYLSNALFRDYAHSGRILPRHIKTALKSRALDKRVRLGPRTVDHIDVLYAHLLFGISTPSEDTLDAFIDRRRDRAFIDALSEHLAPALVFGSAEDRAAAHIREEEGALGRYETLSAWCDRRLGTALVERINREMIKWCEGFLDEDHAAWTMPERERGFYGTWKYLAAREWSPVGIRNASRKIVRLPDNPADALLEHLADLGIREEAWRDYLSVQLAALSGWAGFIKWRADQSDYPWQSVYPADLLQYLAVRLWYERELVRQALREATGTEGTADAIREFIRRGPAQSDRPSAEAERTLRRAAAYRLTALAGVLEVAPDTLRQTPPEDLRVLLDWLEAFPESDHGPEWLAAFEAGYRERLIGMIRTNPGAGSGSEGAVRHQAQAVFCIDVRSESFRRQLETVGDYDTFGFAGFFSVFIRYRALGSHHDTEQFPVIMKAKNEVREIPRPYHGQLLHRHRAGTRLLQAGHAILHDLKENVVTPYVAVETLGWFYGLPLIGKTVFTAWYQRLAARLRRIFVPAVATTLTVDKLSREAVDEMMAAEQRGIIRRALQERFGDRELNLSLERLEFLRKKSLDEPVTDAIPPKGTLSAGEETAFIETLRRVYQIDAGGAFARRERITRTGFTPTEQAFTVGTALRMMGLTRNLARLVLFCGHGSTSDNNPFEAALDCGACGGNPGEANARVLAAMANKPSVRETLVKNGFEIPDDTFFIAGQHDTTTDEVTLFDLEDLPPTHLMDVTRLMRDLGEAGVRNSRERSARFPEIGVVPPPARAVRETRRRGGDWSSVRPEWGLSGNSAFIIGRRDLTRGLDLEGRVFLHSYDFRDDPTDRLLEIVLTGPQVVGQWINMEHYFSTTDTERYGSGSKIYHNVVGRFGIMSGPQSDLRTGLAWQTVMNGPRPFHEPMRMFTLVEAPRERISRIIRRHRVLQNLFDNEWVRLSALDPEDQIIYDYVPRKGWAPSEDAAPPAERPEQGG
jgi:uncharacterized protein YbcC (UPF0753/DUF2309 family)